MSTTKIHQWFSFRGMSFHLNAMAGCKQVVKRDLSRSWNVCKPGVDKLHSDHIWIGKGLESAFLFLRWSVTFILAAWSNGVAYMEFSKCCARYLPFEVQTYSWSYWEQSWANCMNLTERFCVNGCHVGNWCYNLLKSREHVHFSVLLQ